MGLIISVYKSTDHGMLGDYDCTAGGASSLFKKFTLIDAEGPFEPSEDAPAIKLVKRNIGGREYLHLEPVQQYRDGKPADPKSYNKMAGGNFAHSCDSRFPSDYPLSIHDRLEEY